MNKNQESSNQHQPNSANEQNNNAHYKDLSNTKRILSTVANAPKANNKLVITLLSLSLITIMAGAAIAPALSIIKDHFNNADPLLIQMLISIPAFFIIITNFIFPSLCRHMNSRSLVLLGLGLYIVGGCLPFFLNNIYLILCSRALLGIGVGIIMPLSTGLLVYYFAPEELEKLMGYSSAMNQMGGIIATLISGFLANISWRASFLVYLLGLCCLILCLIFLPNDKIKANRTENDNNSPKTWTIFKEYYQFIVAIFLLMMIFFVYPADFALEVASDNIIPLQMVAVIMALLDLFAFAAGMYFVRIKMALGEKARLLSPVCFFIGYALLCFVGGWLGTLLGSFIIGIANGAGIPLINSAASKKAGKAAATTVLPLISAALYLAQFVTPFILSALSLIFVGVQHLPYKMALVVSVIFGLWSFFLLKDRPSHKIK